MIRNIAQATAPHPGASNAEDFQPLTRSPQTAPGQLFPQTEGLQQSAPNDLLQNREATIHVPNNPAAPEPVPTQARSGFGSILIALVSALLVIMLIRAWWHRWHNRQQPEVSSPVAEAKPSINETTAQTQPQPKKTKKKPRGKSKSQRKRKRR